MAASTTQKTAPSTTSGQVRSRMGERDSPGKDISMPAASSPEEGSVSSGMKKRPVEASRSNSSA